MPVQEPDQIGRPSSCGRKVSDVLHSFNFEEASHPVLVSQTAIFTQHAVASVEAVRLLAAVA